MTGRQNAPAHQPGANELAAWRAFLEAHQAVMRNLEAEHDQELELPLSWYDVLVQLSESGDGRLRMTELADAVLLSRSGLTRLVDRMETDGYVCRERCPSDRRGYFAALTPEGRGALAKASPVHLRHVAEHFTDLLDDDELTILRRALDKIRAVNQEVEPAG